MPLPNKARSGGPRTAAGRAVTATNAIKSGAYGAQVVLPGEDLADFEALELGLMRDFEPVGMAERSMVHDLAVLTWKKHRIDRVEHSKMMALALMPLIEADMVNAYGPDWLRESMHRIEPFDPVSREEFEYTSKLLAQVNAVQASAAMVPKAAAFKRRWPELYAALQAWSDDDARDCNDLIEGEEIDGLTLSDALAAMDAECQTDIWLWQNHDKVCQAIQRARDARLFVYMKTVNNDATLRSFNDTSRAYYRTLAALRRQQDWRIRRAAISIDDVIPRLPPLPPDEAAEPGT